MINILIHLTVFQILQNSWVGNWLCIIYKFQSRQLGLLCDEVFKFEIIAWDFSFSVLSLLDFPLIAANEAVWGLNYMNYMNDGFILFLNLQSISFPNGVIMKARGNSIWVIKAVNILSYCILYLGPLQYAAIISIAHLKYFLNLANWT